jgi:Tfp pilus assembly protein PilO
MFRAFLKTLYNESLPALIAGLAICAALLVSTGLVVPQTRAAATRLAALAGYRVLAIANNSHEAVRERIVSDRQKLEAKQALLTGGLTGHGDISATLQLLMEQGRSANVRFIRVQPQAERHDNGLVLYPVLLETSTSYQSLCRLIAAFEAIPHLVRVDRIGITSTTSSSMSVNILVTCFLQPEAGQP